MLKEWKRYEAAPKAKKLARELDVTELTAQALWHRGFRTPEEAQEFLHPEEMPFHDPFLMKDMEAAVERIERAIKKREKIVVYGDYDVDGMTATALLVHNLRALGALTSYYIPDRKKEGYGFNLKALESIAESGAGLLVSVECGIGHVLKLVELVVYLGLRFLCLFLVFGFLFFDFIVTCGERHEFL